MRYLQRRLRRIRRGLKVMSTRADTATHSVFCSSLPPMIKLARVGIGSLLLIAACSSSSTTSGGGVRDASIDSPINLACSDPPGTVCLCGTILCENGAWTCPVCPTDGGSAGGPACDRGSCPSGTVCVQSQANGGVPLEPVDGGCATGDYLPDGGSTCSPEPTYDCAPLPSDCGSSPSCDCASTLCQGGYTCASASATSVMCTRDVP
jgi:hypothetical protein